MRALGETACRYGDAADAGLQGAMEPCLARANLNDDYQSATGIIAPTDATSRHCTERAGPEVARGNDGDQPEVRQRQQAPEAVREVLQRRQLCAHGAPPRPRRRRFYPTFYPRGALPRSAPTAFPAAPRRPRKRSIFGDKPRADATSLSIHAAQVSGSLDTRDGRVESRAYVRKNFSPSSVLSRVDMGLSYATCRTTSSMASPAKRRSSWITMGCSLVKGGAWWAARASVGRTWPGPWS